MSIYAVIETGGKQYRVQPGEIFQVEKLEGEVGTAVKFAQVLLTSHAEGEKLTLGKPYLKGAQVDAEICGQGRGDKILIVKMKRRKQYRRTQGHRQYYTQLIVTNVDNGAGDKVALSADDKKAKLGKFISQLAPKGPAFSIPKVSSRRPEGVEARAAAPKKAAAPKAAAKKKASAKKD